MAEQSYKTMLILHWQEKQEGHDYYGGFMGFFRNKHLKANSHHSKEITEDQANFIVKNLPRYSVSPSTVFDLHKYGGKFYCKDMLHIYIQQEINPELHSWMNRILGR